MGIRSVTVATGGCIVTGVVAMFLSAPYAMAEPDAPGPPPLPGPAVVAAPDAVPADAVAPPDALAATDTVAAPPAGVPHLVTPENLPPGSTMDPAANGNEGPNTSYLKDLFHAVQDQEISGKEALIMGLAQRGMNTRIPQQAPGPNVPLSPGDAAAPPAPAPDAPGAPLPVAPAAPAPTP